jgi:ParB-like chromosome segregation protein Spo0J
VSDAGPAGQIVIVPIDELLPGDSPRIDGEDGEHVRILAETQDALPPIVVHRSTMRVIDGMHRLRAAIARGDSEIAVEYYHGTTADAFIRSVHDNVAHGLPLSRTDREAAVRRIIQSHADLSDRAIARIVGLSPPTVGAIRRRTSDRNFQSNTRIGQDGRRRPLGTVEGRLRASEIISDRPNASLRDVAREAGVSLGTAQDVRKRMNRGESPVPTALSIPQPRSGLVPDAHRRDITNIIHMLRRDPSLRFTEAGRALLQWLGVYTVLSEREQFMNAIPEYYADIIVEVARSCAEAWTQLGNDLEQRSRATSA